MRKKYLTKQETASLCDALGYLLEAGLAHPDALLLLARDEDQPWLQKKLEAMAALTEEGAPLYRALSQAECLDAYVCRLVEVGEQVGKTAETLKELARFYRERAAMEQRLRRALAYPAALLAVLLGVVWVLLTWVMPLFQQTYESLGTGLTGLAGVLLAFGLGLGRALPWIGLGLGAVLAVLALPPTRRWLQDTFSDRGVWRDINSARYLQALNLGLGCGMDEQESARLAARLARQGFAQRCRRVQDRLSQGGNLAGALEAEGFLKAADRRLLEAAKRSGHGQQALTTIANQWASASEEALERKLGRIEPGMVAVACALVAGVLLSVMVPLVSIMNTLG